MSEETKHTPGPWKVMADPNNVGRHPCHDNRWIASADAEVEFGYDPREGQWALRKGVLICEMRDHIAAPSANANLIAAAPDMLAALKGNGRDYDTPVFLGMIADRLVNVYGEPESTDFVLDLRLRARSIRAAIEKAEGRAE